MKIVPITVPLRSELWRRLRLAESLLSHRPLTEGTRCEVLRVLRGESVEVPREVW